ncbi:MAG TPA: ABC transporter permease [Candidatus Sulfopaludibacter sp.]|jgi:putative ABC transport system permease protein|nr:ABC transporter permease [Candidatus Sulfopaludibacter sp.]
MNHTHASFWEAAVGALQSLRGNKLRSFLTLLGIILATTTLIAVMSVISGMDVYIAQNVSNMGADGYRVTRIVMMQWDPKKFLEMQRRNPQLNRDEYNFLRTNATLTKEIGISTNRSVNVHFGKETAEAVTLMGVTPNIAVILNFNAAEGRFLSDTENDRHLNAVFIGNDIKQKFFPAGNPIGQSISLEGLPFEVVGVAEAKGSVFGQSQDNFVIVPAETYFKIWGSRAGMDYAALAIDHDHLIQAQDEARTLIRSYRHLGPRDDDTFSTLTSDALLKFWDQLTASIAATAVGVVSVFMVVGGVVIMNIMLAVVTERTREIGIRKSVGARRSDILNQFLVESAMLSGMGGLAGVILAWCVAVLVRTLTPVPMAVPIGAVFAGVTLSTIVGLFFGIYPAQRAARLDPIEALRAEK